MLGCLSVKARKYARHEFVMRFGDSTEAIGMVLSGSVHIVKEDFWGNRNIVTEIGPGQIFAESYACTPGAALGVSVVAAEAAAVMFMNVRRVLTTCSSACEFHSRLLRNLLSVLAEKNLRFNDKLTHMAQRTTRQKLLSYLSAESMRLGSPEFDITFNRQQLADYLSVDRSAMSGELSKMRDEGLLDFYKSHFRLRQG
ncbi:Crp/Fnr family transcriptional regulator [Cloacibacillus evryensis]